jgi:general secretion pathway protein J
MKNRVSSGFTLLEMILAITVFAVVVILVGSAMRLGYRSADAGEKRMESTERLRRSMMILEGQIQSSLPLTFDEGGETKSYFVGTRKALTLATNYSIWEGRKGYVVAEYAVKDEPSGKESLEVAERTIGTERKLQAVLLENCDAIEFEYLEKGLTEGDTKWISDWSDEEKSPERIRVHIRYRAWDYSLVIPVRVGGVA